MSDKFGKISIDPEVPGIQKKKKKRRVTPSPAHKKTAAKGIAPGKMLWILIPVGIIALYSIVGFFGVPYYMQHSIPKQLSEKYQLTLSAEKVSYNPFNFTLKSQANTVSDAKGGEIARIQNLELNFAPIQLLRMDFVCNKVQIDSPSIHLVRYDDDTYNISSLLPDVKKRSDNGAMMGFSDLPFFFSLNNISISDGTLVFDDKPTSKTHRIEKLELQLPTLSNIAFQANSYIAPHFSAIVNGSPVSLKDKSQTNESRENQDITQLSWDLENINLQDYVSYLPFELPFSINKGTASGVIELRFNNHETRDDKLTVSFDLSIADIDFITQKQKLELKSEAMKVAGSFIPVQRVFSVSTLHLEAPEFTANSENLLQDMSDLLFMEKNRADQPVAVEKPVVFSLGSFTFTQGKLKQIKTSTEDKNNLEFTGLELQMRNYVTDQSYANADSSTSILQLSGRSKKESTFSYMGTFESPTAIEGELSLSNMSSQSLFTFIFPKDTPFTSTGSGTLKATLHLSKDGEDNKLKTFLSKVVLDLKDVSVQEDNTPVITAKELSLRGAKLWDSGHKLGDITIKKGQLNFSQRATPAIFAKINSGQYNISSLNYDGEITIQPKTTKEPPLRLKNAAIQYSSNDTSEKKSNSIVLSGLTGTDGKVNATGKLRFAPFTMSVSTTFNHVNSSEISSLFPQHSFIARATGELSGKGTFTFPQSGFTGDFTLVKGQLVQNQAQPLAWKELKLENVNYTTQPYHVGVGRILINQPQFTATIEQNQGSMPEQLVDYLRNTLEKNGNPGNDQKKISISKLDIQEIAITKGQVSLHDNRLSPLWTGVIDDLKGSIEDIHYVSSASASPFTFTGTLDGTAFTWAGTVNPFTKNTTEKDQFKLTNYPLTHFSAQLQPLSDMDFSSAVIDLTLISEWKDDTRSQSLQSTISGIKPVSLDAESALPLAMLTDSKGDVQLNIASLSPSSSYSSLFNNLRSDLQKRIVKGNISPLLLASGDFSDLIDNEFIDFKPGLFMLSDAGRNTLSRYGALLIAHPNIKLTLTGGIISQLDRQSIHEQLEKNEKERVEKENEKLFAQWQQKKKEYEAQVESNQDNALSQGVIAESDMPTKVLTGFRPLLPEPVVVDDEMLLELAERRLDIVKKHFMTQLSLTKGRVEVPQQSTDQLFKEGYGKGVHVKLLPFDSPLFQ